MDATGDGIAKIAEAQVLDVLSLGIDQDAQEHFYHPERQDPRRKGAGGVPVRSEQDYRTLHAASRRGNFPLLRTYSGTDDFIRRFWFGAHFIQHLIKIKPEIFPHSYA